VLIDGAVVNTAGADVSDTAYFEQSGDLGDTFAAAEPIGGFYGGNDTYCESPPCKTYADEIATAVYGDLAGTFTIKFVVRVGGMWTDRADIAEGYECCVGRVAGAPSATTLLAIFDERITRRMQASVSTDNGVTWSVPLDLGFGQGGRASWIQFTSGALVIGYRGTDDGDGYDDSRGELRYLSAADVAAGNWAGWSDPWPVSPVDDPLTYVQLEESSPGIVSVQFSTEQSPAGLAGPWDFATSEQYVGAKYLESALAAL
jgi:hypothetical protein